MPTSLPNQDSSFYELLQAHPELDLRDNRGKRHDLALVLLGVSLSLFRGRDGTLSGIHRSMQHFQSKLCEHLGIDYKEVVSRSQLPLILEKVDVVQFSRFLKKWVGVELNPGQRQCFGVDGKELRGSIEKGNKRGEAIVHVVSHEGKQSIGCHFFMAEKQVMAILRSNTTTVFQNIAPPNMTAHIPWFQDDFDKLASDLATIGFLQECSE